ncbi:MAG TPA: FAD-dependent thymidylate synthase [Candidatus Saccharimonadales bacterium]|nr:FAD-dependent thymidylate synthase [Candidatus Saccharimonadales bacterium]
MEENKNPYIKRAGERIVITAKGQKYLDQIVTDAKGPVYAFYGKASPLMVAAAMARLSRRSSDLRETFLDEFALSGDEDAAGLIHRVVTAFGDDSVQQLIGLHIVIEDASNLLTKLLEWGRFAAYLEQSTRYIFFDEKDKSGNFRYFVPTNLDAKTKKEYVKVHNEVFTLYSKMVRTLTDYVRRENPEPEDEREKMAWRGATKAQACDAVRPILPVSTKATVGIFGSAQAIESLILHLLAEELMEPRLVGQQILDEARKVIPSFLERADKPDRGGATTAHRANTKAQMASLAKEKLNEKSKDFGQEVKLIDYWPKDELDVIPHLLFANSNLSTKELTNQLKNLNNGQKEEIFKSYVGERFNRRHKPGRAMEIPHYLWEITADYGTFRDLQRHRVVDAFEWQKLGIDYGYEVPDLVKKAGLEKDFRKCFDLSHKLYESLIKAGYSEEAQYAVLFGHRMRYKFILNARAAFHFIELRSAPQGHPGYRRITNKMHEELAKVHPLTAKAMQFVNKDEDPKLTRMAAELATQYKLERLDKLSRLGDRS